MCPMLSFIDTVLHFSKNFKYEALKSFLKVFEFCSALALRTLNLKMPYFNFLLSAGLIHLEALEMLSGQSKIKVEARRIQSASATEMSDLLDQIDEVCSDLPDVDEGIILKP